MDGSHMSDFLLKKGHKVFGLVRRSASGSDKNYRHNLGNPNFKIIHGDITDLPSVCNMVKDIQPDYFINFAAQSNVPQSWISPVSTFEIDALGTLNCLEAIRQNKINCRFYSAGTSEQFSEVEYIPQDEKHERSAKSPYGAAKIAAEQLVRVYRHSYGMYAIHGILYNHESERRNKNFLPRKVSLAVAKIKRDMDNGLSVTPLEVGYLDSERDWSYAVDFMDGIWRMLNQELYREELSQFDYSAPVLTKLSVSRLNEYVLSSGRTYSVRHLIAEAFSCAGIKGGWIRNGLEEVFISLGTDRPSFGGTVLVKINPEFYRPFEVTKLHGTYSKINKELDWSPTTPFKQLVEKMVKHDIENQES